MKLPRQSVGSISPLDSIEFILKLETLFLVGQNRRVS